MVYVKYGLILRQIQMAGIRAEQARIADSIVRARGRSCSIRSRVLAASCRSPTAWQHATLFAITMALPWGRSSTHSVAAR